MVVPHGPFCQKTEEMHFLIGSSCMLCVAVCRNNPIHYSEDAQFACGATALPGVRCNGTCATGSPSPLQGPPSATCDAQGIWRPAGSCTVQMSESTQHGMPLRQHAWPLCFSRHGHGGLKVWPDNHVEAEVWAQPCPHLEGKAEGGEGAPCNTTPKGFTCDSAYATG
jgi:hypothetical protein